MRYCKLIIMRIPDSTSICHIHHHNLHEHIPGRYTDCLQFPQEFKKIQLLYITWCNQGCDNNISKIKCPLSLESDSQNRAAFRWNLKFWLGFGAEPQQVFARGKRQGNALFSKCHDTCPACRFEKSRVSWHLHCLLTLLRKRAFLQSVSTLALLADAISKHYRNETPSGLCAVVQAGGRSFIRLFRLLAF